LNFIELQKLRLSSKTDIQYNIEGMIPESKLVIPLIFEPFIDNSFKHAIRNPAALPYIHISVIFIEEYMRFTIINNHGQSFSSPNSKTSGIGLKNIEKRLEYLYAKEEYKYEVQQTEDTFTTKLEILLKNES
jgi:two-component system LytT family sensor kinase